MIRFVIENGNNCLKFDMPTCELAEHMGSIGICKDIPIGGTENVSVDYYPAEDDDKIAKIVCDRLLPEDKISDVNQLCEKLDGCGELPPRSLKAPSRKMMFAAL